MSSLVRFSSLYRIDKRNNLFLHNIKRNNNVFARLISRKNKNYDPRKKTVVTQNERIFRGFIFSIYGLFFFFLFIPGSNYKNK